MESQRLDPYQVSYQNREEFLELKREIFTHHCYYFECESPAPIIIDAGAHVGMATLYFKKLYPAAKIWAVEPHPLNLELLQKNISDNHLTDVTVIGSALTDHQGTVAFHADTEFEWFSSASVHAHAWNGLQKTEEFRVPATTLSDVIEAINEPIDLLKLDIEGSEFAALRGAKRLLSQIKLLICEFHPTASQDRDEFIMFLERQNFTVSTEFDTPDREGKRLEMIEATHN